MDINEALQQLCDEVKKILHSRIQKYGVNQRTGENTLEGSELEKSITVTPIENGIALQIADYWWYVASGWKRTHNDNKMGLYNELVLWALRKRIRLDDMTGMSQNEAAVRVAEIVWTKMIVWGRPIAARPFMIPDEEGDLTKMIPELDAYIDKWIDGLYDDLIKELDKYFNG